MHSHTPVLLEEVIRFLVPHPGGSFIDATLGGGGHSRAILDRITPGGRLLAIDQDEGVLAARKEDFGPLSSPVLFVHSNFKEVAALAERYGFLECDGILADIGISSMMVDDASRGFSFMREGPLDMRMDRNNPLTAAEVVNTYSEKDIADILYKFGEERRSRPIARSIVRSRPLRTTTDLTRAIARIAGSPRRGQIHPATRTFQALRIYVNDELNSLEKFLDSSMSVVRSGGRIVVISFHSLEDRIVKQKFRAPSVSGQVLTKKVVVAGQEEVDANPRSRSAKLRAWERS